MDNFWLFIPLLQQFSWANTVTTRRNGWELKGRGGEGTGETGETEETAFPPKNPFSFSLLPFLFHAFLLPSASLPPLFALSTQASDSNTSKLFKMAEIQHEQNTLRWHLILNTYSYCTIYTWNNGCQCLTLFTNLLPQAIEHRTWWFLPSIIILKHVDIITDAIGRIESHHSDWPQRFSFSDLLQHAFSIVE